MSNAKRTVRDLLARTGVSVESYMATPSREKEFTMYAELASLDELDRLAVDKEKHEQWKLPTDSHIKGSIRLRATNDRRFEITSKQFISDVESIETTSLLIKSAFDELKKFCVDGYYKIRYTMPVEGTDLKWEFDVFYTKGGAQSPWVKIDLEVNSLDTTIPDLPVAVRKLILANDPELTRGDQAMIDKLWSDEWAKIEPTIAVDPRRG